jgi:hypothetical protein
MPPRKNSRYSFTTARTDTVTGKLFLSPRDPFLYRELPDNIVHTVTEGDTWQLLAARYYASLGRLPKYSAALLYWVIQDFQPGGPVHDPTIRLVPGQTLVLPSVNVTSTQILARPPA